MNCSGNVVNPNGILYYTLKYVIRVSRGLYNSYIWGSVKYSSAEFHLHYYATYVGRFGRHQAFYVSKHTAATSYSVYIFGLCDCWVMPVPLLYPFRSFFTLLHQNVLSLAADEFRCVLRMEMDSVATVVLCSLWCGVKYYMYSMTYIELFFCVIFISVCACGVCTIPQCFCCFDSVSWILFIGGVGGLVQQHCQ
jgi:hypothetical protein